MKRAKVLAGYAGWGPGQLEGEMARGDWVTEPALPEDVFTARSEELWRDVLRRKGGKFLLLFTMAYDPDSN